jgi:cardiolipin synthase (CMP-forming)
MKRNVVSSESVGSAFNPPNLITYARILATPVVGWALLNDRCVFGFWLMFVAGLTDAIDGWLARRFGWQSRLGAYLDPVADKFLLTTLYVAFAVAGLSPEWLAWLVVGRDVLILGMVATAMMTTTIRDFPPSLLGKVSTAVQIATAAVLAGRCAFPSIDRPWTDAVVLATAVITVFSGIDYVVRALKRLHSYRTEKA